MRALLLLVACLGCGEAWRSRLPETRPYVEVATPVIEERHLGNGVAVYVGTTTSPLVRVVVGLSAGAVDGKNPDQAFTSIALMARRAEAALDESVPGHDQVKVSALVDESSMAVTVLREDAGAAMRALAVALVEPGCDAAGLGEVEVMLAGARAQDSERPTKVAMQLMATSAVGDHPWSHVLESLAPTTSCEEVLAWRAENVGPARLAVVVTGGITAPEAVELTKQSLGGWRADLPPRRMPEPVAREAEVTLVARPGARQSLIAVGGLLRVRPGDELPSHLALWTYEGRLLGALRGEQSMAYSATVQAFLVGDRILFFASARVANEETAEAIATFFDTMEPAGTAGYRTLRWRRHQLARLAQRHMLALQTVEDFADLALDLHARGLPVTTPHDELRLLSDMDWDQVDRWSEAALRPEAMHVVVMGDPSALEQARQELSQSHPACESLSARCKFAVGSD